MSHIPKILRSFGRLLDYPNDQTAESAELLYIILQDELPESARDVASFGAFLEQHELWEVEEAYTRVFDISPDCALEIGWHLFGEEYARGMFLVRMREELRKYNLPETTELPDHISHVLDVAAAMPDKESDQFVPACVQPAIEKMRQSLQEQETPYKHLLDCLAAVLKHAWGEIPESPDGDSSRPFAGDPLHAFPVAGLDDGSQSGGCQSGGCDGGSCDSGDFVSLEMNLPPGESDHPVDLPVMAVGNNNHSTPNKMREP